MELKFLKSPLVNIRDPYHQQDAMKVLPLNKPGNAGFANLTYMNTTKHDSRTIWGPQLPSARCGLEGSFRPLGFRIRVRGAERYDKRPLVFDSKWQTPSRPHRSTTSQPGTELALHTAQHRALLRKFEKRQNTPRRTIFCSKGALSSNAA